MDFDDRQQGQASWRQLQQGLLEVPRHPTVGVCCKLIGIAQKNRYILEGIDPHEVARMNHAHEKVSNPSSRFGSIIKRGFSMAYYSLECSFNRVMPTAGLCRLAGSEPVRTGWVSDSHGTLSRHNHSASRKASRGSGGMYRSGTRPESVACARACSLSRISACK